MSEEAKPIEEMTAKEIDHFLRMMGLYDDPWVTIAQTPDQLAVLAKLKKGQQPPSK